MTCPGCGEPTDRHDVELVRDRDGTRVRVHGSCLLAGYTGQAFVEDEPKAWTHGAHSDLPLEEHVARLAEAGAETYQESQ